MGGKDLNLKKSWHVNLMSNQKKVWEAEQSALDERKKIEQLRREREEERAMEEIAKLQEAAGGRVKQQRVDWMYQGASNSITGVTDEQESYLLGKRRVDNLILKQDQETKAALRKDGGGLAAGMDSDVAAQLSSRDLVTKTALDPLMAIEMQRQKMMEEEVEKMMRRQKLREGKEKKKDHRRNERDGDRRSHRRERSSRYDEDDGDDRRSHKRRRYSDEDRGERSRRNDRDGRHGTSHRRRSPSRSRSRSNSPDRSRRDRERRSTARRSPSPQSSRRKSARSPNRHPDRRDRYDDRYSRTQRDDQSRHSRTEQRQNSRSPDDRAKRRNTSSERSRSPYQRQERSSYRRSRSPKPRNNTRSSLPTPPDANPSQPTQIKPEEDTKSQDRAAKLVAMQADARQLETDREKRLADMAERDAHEKQVEDEKRSKGAANAPGGYVAGLRKQVQGVELGSRLGAGNRRGGLERLENSF